jgi:hypothetical protein
MYRRPGPAGDADGLAADSSRPRGGQESHHIGDLVDRHRAADGIPVGSAPQSFLLAAHWPNEEAVVAFEQSGAYQEVTNRLAPLLRVAPKRELWAALAS